MTPNRSVMRSLLVVHFGKTQYPFTTLTFLHIMPQGHFVGSQSVTNSDFTEGRGMDEHDNHQAKTRPALPSSSPSS